MAARHRSRPYRRCYSEFLEGAKNQLLAKGHVASLQPYPFRLLNAKACRKPHSNLKSLKAAMNNAWRDLDPAYVVRKVWLPAIRSPNRYLSFSISNFFVMSVFYKYRAFQKCHLKRYSSYIYGVRVIFPCCAIFRGHPVLIKKPKKFIL